MDDATRDRIDAAAFRALRHHLIDLRPDVQNIDLMNMAGFCRNCLARWWQEAAAVQGFPLTKDEARTAYYGIPYADWVASRQTPADSASQATFESAFAANVGPKPPG